MLQIDEELQKIANKLRIKDIKTAASAIFTLDVTDCDAYVDGQISGVEIGLQLAAEAKPGQDFFKITFADYGDDDGIAILVGTREEVKQKLEAMDARDDWDDEEGDDC